MARYFFDVDASGSVQYDFSGRCFKSPEHAQDLAELIAMDLACLQVYQSIPTEVQVRDAVGQQLFSVPVKMVDVVAA